VLPGVHNGIEEATMSLFGFVKDIGRRLFNKDEEAAEKIKEHILAHNPGVEDLGVTFENGIVGLSGRCTNRAAFQKCVLMAGNVQGVVDVYASGLVPYVDPAAAAAAAAAAAPSAAAAAKPAEPEGQYYVIEKGDTLWAIAKKFLGSGNRYPEIFEANREVIIDPDKIFPGQKIIIPPK
jgi:LysM repeat protein